MRPLRLRLRGFGPFRDEVDIDFADLELFALVGDTGSGKSTIIDALTFALYGSVVRYDDMRLVAPVINTASNEATVLLDFSVDDIDYRATRVVRRTTTGASTAEARLECGDTVLAATRDDLNDAVEALIGLNFARFVKVIVLPQGRFASFLHDGASDRQALLRDLLDLGVYQKMRAGAHERHQRATQRREAIDAALDAMGVSDEALAAAKAEAGAAAQRQHAVEAAAATWRARSDHSETAAHEAEAIGVLALAYGAVTVPAEVERFDETRAAITVELDEAIERAANARAERDRIAADVEAAPAIEVVDQHLARYERLGRLKTELAAQDARLVQLHAEHAVVTDQLSATQAELDGAEAALEAAEAARDQARDALSQGPHRDEIQAWLEAASTLDRLESELVDAEAVRDTAVALLTASAESLEDAQADRTSAAAAFEAAQLANRVAAVALSVSVGDDCPVCGNVVESLSTHAASGTDLAALQKRLSDADKALAIVRDEAAQAKAQHDEAQRQLVDRTEKRDAARAALIVDRAEAEAAQEVWGERSKALDTAETVRREADDRVRGLRRDGAVPAIIDRLRSLETALAAVDAEQAQRQTILDELAGELTGVATVEELLGQRQELEALLAARARAGEALTAADQDVIDATARRDELQATEARLRRDFHQIRDRFSGDLGAPEDAGGSVADEWRRLAQWAATQSAVALDLYHDEQRRAEQLRAERDAAALAVRGAAGVDGDEPIEDVVAAVADADAAAQSRLGVLVEQQATVADQRRERKELTEQIEVYGQLHRLLRTTGFEAWLLDDILFDLVERASERLHVLSQGQYSLEMGNERFDVVDHRNGDERRMAKTLSGGETFTASLALALALADVLGESPTSTSPPIEALFLDEGFGTLDPEHLDVVAAVLEELGSSGRMVGVVTHIRALADRMPVRLEVAAGERSATVKRRDT